MRILNFIKMIPKWGSSDNFQSGTHSAGLNNRACPLVKTRAKNAMCTLISNLYVYQKWEKNFHVLVYWGPLLLLERNQKCPFARLLGLCTVIRTRAKCIYALNCSFCWWHAFLISSILVTGVAHILNLRRKI